MTMVDLFTRPDLVQKSWDYFRSVQTKDRKYQTLLGADDKPPTWLNAKIMAEYRERMRKFYYDPSKHATYLEQLGIKYPTVRSGPASP
jgi:aminobenzoyl-glutamate utilization protein B